jgi:hypothetical protein
LEDNRDKRIDADEDPLKLEELVEFTAPLRSGVTGPGSDRARDSIESKISPCAGVRRTRL